MILVKSALRVIAWKKLETVAVILVALVAVLAPASLAIIKSNLDYQIYELFRDVSGDVMLTGVIPGESLDALRGLEGVKRVDGTTITFGLLGGERALVAVMGDEAFNTLVKLHVIKEGRAIRDPGEAVVYRAMFVRGHVELPKVGDSIDLVIVTGREPVEFKLKVVGLATGYNHVGPTPFMVVVKEELLRSVTNNTLTAVRLEVVEDPRSVAGEAKSAIEGLGGVISWHIVNTRDENPVVLIVESAMSVMTLPVLIFIAMTPVLSASLGLATVVRDSRTIAVMKALGCGLKELFTAYSLPWIIRVALGVLLGFLISPFASKWLYLNYFVEDVDLSRALYERFGFNPYWGIAAYYAIIVLGLAILGSLVPLAVAYRVNVVDVISTVGLYAHQAPRVGWSIGRLVAFRMWVRDMISRWWKTIGLVLPLSLLLGLGSSGLMLSSGLEEWVKTVEDRSLTRFDAILTVTIAGDLERFLEFLEKLRGEGGYVKGYFVSTPYTLASAIEGLTFIELRALVKGDPSIEFPLIHGRYPESRGEVVISKGLADYKGLKVGDTLKLRDTFGRVHELEVVGIARAYHDRGYQLLLTQESLWDIRGYEEGLGRASTVKVAIELRDPSRFEEALESLQNDIRRAGPYGVEVESRDSIASTFKGYSTMVIAITAAMSLLASVVVAIIASTLIASDVSARTREIAVLASLGLHVRQLILGYTIQLVTSIALAIPLAYITSNTIARLLAERTANFIGYIEPVTSPQMLLTANTITPLTVVLIVTIVVTFFTLRKLDMVRALSDL